MRRLLAAALAAQVLVAPVVQAKVIVTWDDTFGYTLEVNQSSADFVYQFRTQQLNAVRAILDRTGADYMVVPPSALTTWMLKKGVVYRRVPAQAAASFGYDSLQVVYTADAVIDLCFNGTDGTAIAAAPRPDSLTLTRTNRSAGLPLVPHLFVIEDHRAFTDGSMMDDAASCSTGVVPFGMIQSVGGLALDEGQITDFSTEGPWRWFEMARCPRYILDNPQPAGGVHVLIGGTQNAVGETMRFNGAMSRNPDSCNSTINGTSDTMVVWERLNSHFYYGANNTQPARPIVFCRFSSNTGSQATTNFDSLGFTTYGAGDYVSLYLAMCHLDSLSGGKVFGPKKAGIGFVVTNAGNRSSRQNPGGICGDDTTYRNQAADSCRARGLPILLAVDAESTLANGDIAALRRFGNIRVTPAPRRGLDTTVVSTATEGTLSSPVDFNGRYRNRAFYGDSAYHYVIGSDFSVYNYLTAARRQLATLGLPMSSTVVPPDFDCSPYQVRRGQNVQYRDSLFFAYTQAGYNTVVTLNKGRDWDPSYIAGPIVGWQNAEGRFAQQILPGAYFKMMCAAQWPVSGSTKFMMGENRPSGADTTAPYTDAVQGPRPSIPVQFENRFWLGFWSPGATAGFPVRAGAIDATHFRDYIFTPYDYLATAWGAGVMYDPADRLWGTNRGSICAVPMQWFGGPVHDQAYAITSTVGAFPTLPGWVVFKHISNVVDAGNKFAGRVVTKLGFPEDIDP